MVTGEAMVVARPTLLCFSYYNSPVIARRRISPVMTDAYPHDADCIFCRIASGLIPCHELAADEHVLAFLDTGPLSQGHALVIPRAHYVTIDRMPADLAAACGALIPRLSGAIMAATGASAWNVLQNNGKLAHQAVDHVHFHVIPRTEEQGLGITWPSGRLTDDDARSLAGRIRRQIQGAD